MEPAAAPLPYSRIGAPRRLFEYLKDGGRSLARLARRRTRTAHIVASEYDQGHWSNVLRDQAWLRAKSVKDFLAGSSDAQMICRIDGHVVSARATDYYRYRMGALARLLSELAGPDTRHILELGSGFGYNLLSLMDSGPFETGTGLELSPTGIDAARQAAAHFGLGDRLSFDTLDLTDAAHPNFGRIAGQTCFTYFVLEQIPYDIEAVIGNIVAARPRRVIHFEPTTELLRPGSIRDAVSYLYIKSVDYQTRLFTHLRELESKGVLRVLKQQRVPFAPTIHNDGFIAVWEPTP